MAIFKPMKGVEPDPNHPLSFPLLASPKIDGLRAVVKGGVVLSNSLKPIPSLWVQKRFGYLEGLDGELTVGLPYTQPDDGPDGVFGRTRGPLMRKSDAEVAVQFNVFDRWDRPEDPFKQRFESLEELVGHHSGVVIVPHYAIPNEDRLGKLEGWAIESGFEGLILRAPEAGYKYGRGTAREQGMLKLKRFEDGEAMILDVTEQCLNINEAYTDELGRTKRSMSQAGMIGKDTLGAFVVRDLKTGQEFSIGTGRGLTHRLRDTLWRNRQHLAGKILRFKYQECGTKDAPRIPLYNGFRDSIDISLEE